MRPRPPPSSMARFVFLLSSAVSLSSSTFDRTHRTPPSRECRGFSRGRRIFFFTAYYLSPSISHATKDALVSAPRRGNPRRSASASADNRSTTTRRPKTRAAAGCPPSSLSTGAAWRYRDSDRWISSIICDAVGISRDCDATVVASYGVDCIQRGYLIVLEPSYLRRTAPRHLLPCRWRSGFDVHY